MNQPIATAIIQVTNPQGIHARPADMFVKLAVQFQSTIAVIKDGTRSDGKSILDMLTLAAVAGSQLQLEAVGPDAQLAVDALAELVRNGFGENDQPRY